MMGTIITPSSGACHVAGSSTTTDSGDVRRRIGFLSGNTKLYGRMTGREILRYFGRLYGMALDDIASRTETLIDMLDMSEFVDRRCDIGGVRVGPRADARCRAVGVAVAGQVGSEERPPERHRDRVPRVGVLGAAVDQHELRKPAPPHQAADRAPVGEPRRGAPHHGGPVERQPVLGGVLVEQPELVVLHPIAHEVHRRFRATT